jgi:hypothetical protein
MRRAVHLAREHRVRVLRADPIALTVVASRFDLSRA